MRYISRLASSSRQSCSHNLPAFQSKVTGTFVRFIFTVGCKGLQKDCSFKASKMFEDATPVHLTWNNKILQFETEKIETEHWSRFPMPGWDYFTDGNQSIGATLINYFLQPAEMPTTIDVTRSKTSDLVPASVIRKMKETLKLQAKRIVTHCRRHQW